MPIELLKSEQSKTALTGFLSGAAGGALASSLTKNKSAKKLLKAGGLMAVGGLALKAWQTHSAGKHQSATSEQTGATVLATQAPPIPQAIAPEREASLLIQSMIAAAHADGVLTPDEQNKIWQEAVSSNLPTEELGLVQQALEKPMSVSELASLPTTMEEKIEAFTAAAVVVEDGCAAGQTFLEQLGGALSLPTGLSAALIQQIRAQA